MKRKYDCPETDLVQVTVAENFFSSHTPVKKSDEGMESYQFERWDFDD